jgi:hypothetical protein
MCCFTDAKKEESFYQEAKAKQYYCRHDERVFVNNTQGKTARTSLIQGPYFEP